MEKDKVVFLDRDGVINVDKGYVHKIDDFELIEGVVDALKFLNSLGYKIVILTNQSGIARGYYSLEDFVVLNNYMLEYFESFGVEILDVQFCPHHINGVVEEFAFECNCRKPDIGMFESAVEKFDLDIDFENSFMVGDKQSDILAGEKFGVKSYLVSDKVKLIDIVEKLFG